MVQIGRKIKKIVLGKKYKSKTAKPKPIIKLPNEFATELKKADKSAIELCSDTDRAILAGNEYITQLKKAERSYIPPTYVPETKIKTEWKQNKLETLAYYLPQFHTFEENEKWWGKGFTEWTNVTRARPQFSGHYQPQLPSDSGFYDLRVKESMKRQVELAKLYGLTGFIFYHYWFDGKRLMEKPLEDFLANKNLDFNYCLCWANENFTRRWDGAETEVLLEQVHTPENDEKFIKDMVKYLEDPRYITIDNRPVIIVYRVGLLPDALNTTNKWREVAKKILGKDLFLVYARTFNETRTPESLGFDCAIEFPPHFVSAKLLNNDIYPFNPDYNGNVYDYNDLITDAENKFENIDIPLIPAVFPSWDNTARRGMNATVFHHSTPGKYADWLAISMKHALENPVHGRSIVVVNAWNEWAEGAHLEPCQQYGHSYLHATRNTLRIFNNFNLQTEINTNYESKTILYSESPTEMRNEPAIIIHAYYMDVLKEILEKIPTEYFNNIFITTTHDKIDEVQDILTNYREIKAIFVNQNKGRDVLPFIRAISEVKSFGYKYFVKLHTKKTVHRNDGNKWFNDIINSFLPLFHNNDILSDFESNEELGLVGPQNHVLDGEKYRGSPRNKYWIEKLGKHFSIDINDTPYNFVAGSMFFGKIQDFMMFSGDKWLYAQFEEECGQIDGTVAHALERFFGYLCTYNHKNIFYYNPSTQTLENAEINDHYQYANAMT